MNESQPTGLSAVAIMLVALAAIAAVVFMFYSLQQGGNGNEGWMIQLFGEVGGGFLPVLAGL